MPTIAAMGADYAVQPVPSKQVKVTDGFWATKLEVNRTVTIPHLFKMNDENERLNNLRKGAGLMPGPYISRRYNDTDVYKLLEAVGYSLMLHPDPALEKIADEQIEIIAKAQQPDGYIYPARTIDPKNPAPGAGAERWSREGGSHELYNQGHMIEAGVVYSQATGNPRFLELAKKCGDMLCNTFGPDKRHDTSGHEEIELALVKLYGATKEKKYLDLAQFFIDQRGQPHTFGDYSNDAPSGFLMYNDRPYRQDDKPVIEQQEAQGHAVRATYLYSGLTDVAALTGVPAYTKATDRLWENVVGKKMYVTGGVGSVGGTEAFAANYVLPNNAYAESCAQIGNALWNERLFQLHGDAKYLDVMERVVYNGLISGISEKGDTFFYQNPLQAGPPRGGRGGRRRGGAQATNDTANAATNAVIASSNTNELGGTGISSAPTGPRQPWFDVACCPANLARFVAQFPGYIYATEKDALFVNFFTGNEADVSVNGTKVHLKQETTYPWTGNVKLQVEPEKEVEFAVKVRIPGWAEGKALPSDLYSFQSTSAAKDEPIAVLVNNERNSLNLKNGFAVIKRSWRSGDTIEVQLPMRPRVVMPNGKIEADKGRVVIQQGPLVYCVEAMDNGGKVLDREFSSETASLKSEFRKNLLGGINVITGKWADGSDLMAVPYYAWGNRGNNEMCVWIKVKGSAE
jgi:DUF1680 family protein